MAQLIIDEETCKGCGLCSHFCPQGILEFADHLNSKGYHPAKLSYPEKCTACAICALMCPDLAIELRKEAN